MGAGQDGAQFVRALAALTSADVAASNNNTGGTDARGRSGDWDLEITSGTINHAPAINVQALSSPGSYNHLLIILDTTAPVFANAAVNGNQLVLSYTDANNLDAVNPPPTSAFAVSIAGTTAPVADAVTGVAVNATAKTVTLTLATAVAPGQKVTVAYSDPTAGNDLNAIQDVAGNDAASIQAIAINTTRPNTAPTFAAVVGTGKVVTDIGTNTLDQGQSVTV